MVRGGQMRKEKRKKSVQISNGTQRTTSCQSHGGKTAKQQPYLPEGQKLVFHSVNSLNSLMNLTD